MPIVEMKTSVKTKIEGGYWPGYFHCYPHKKSYRSIKGFKPSLEWANYSGDLNLYFHIPFCNLHCSYCNLFKTVLKDKTESDILDDYVEALIKEFELTTSLIGTVNIRSIYIGGGTPTILGLDRIRRILQVINSKFSINYNEIEACIETQPIDISKKLVVGLKSLGIKRISMGIQTLKAEIAVKIGRGKTLCKVESSIKIIKDSGLNLNLDMIYGLPNQDLNSFLEDLQKILSYEPDNICCYPLAIRKKTRMYDQSHQLASSLDKYEMWDVISNYLMSNGYNPETYVRFSKSQNTTYKQQILEFKGVPTLGSGAGARSYAEEIHYCLPYKVDLEKSSQIINRYISDNPRTYNYTGFQFDISEQKRKTLVLSLISGGISIGYFNILYEGADLVKDFNSEISELKELNLIEISDDILRLTYKGLKYSDITLESFVSQNVWNLEHSFRID